MEEMEFVGGKVSFQFITPNHNLYPQEITLRYELLRKPLNMTRQSVYFPYEADSMHCIGLDSASEVVACVLFHSNGDGSGRLFQMAVHPKWQGKKVGTSMVKFLEEELMSQGIEKVVIHARDHALKFYQTLGFEVFGDEFIEVQNFAGRGQIMDNIQFIDIGVNLTDPVFHGIYRGKKAHDDDFNDMLQRSWDTGMDKMLVTGGCMKDSKDALKLCEKHDNLYCTVGVHPTRANDFDKDPKGPEAHLEAVLDLIRTGGDKVKAVGEFGLDYDRTNYCSIDVQKQYFELQFRVVEQTNLPLFLHMRNATKDFMDIVMRHRETFKNGVVHSFTGTKDDLEAVLDAGLYVGVNGCSLKTQENIDVMKLIPEDKIMLETDAPWCDIRPSHVGSSFITTKWPTKKKERFEAGSCVKSRNEPCHIRQVLEVVSHSRGVEPEHLGKCAYENTKKVFFPDL